ncbi:MAG TPA: nuclear transport factor 2 family protein [Acidimicrobiales bacterium]|nr:nuclear transport factor 2 family protein [Acidimicrobiales bacterium]
MSSSAIAFRDALCDRDFDAVRALLADEVVLRGLLPSRTIEATGSDDILGWFTKWFATGPGFEVLGRDADTTAGRTRVTWRFRFSAHPVMGEPGVHEIEQTAYVDESGGCITRIDLLCSGFRPMTESVAPEFCSVPVR